MTELWNAKSYNSIFCSFIRAIDLEKEGKRKSPKMLTLKDDSIIYLNNMKSKFWKAYEEVTKIYRFILILRLLGEKK